MFEYQIINTFESMNQTLTLVSYLGGWCLTSDNKLCIFPWTYSVDGSNHQGCANPFDDPGGLWCPTAVDDTGTYISGSGNWGYCSDNCYTEPGKNYRFITKNPC